jgi:hypothetical protein
MRDDEYAARYLLSGAAAAGGALRVARLLNYGAEGPLRCASCGLTYEYRLFCSRSPSAHRTSVQLCCCATFWVLLPVANVARRGRSAPSEPAATGRSGDLPRWPSGPQVRPHRPATEPASRGSACATALFQLKALAPPVKFGQEWCVRRPEVRPPAAMASCSAMEETAAQIPWMTRRRSFDGQFAAVIALLLDDRHAYS